MYALFLYGIVRGEFKFCQASLFLACYFTCLRDLLNKHPLFLETSIHVFVPTKVRILTFLAFRYIV